MKLELSELKTPPAAVQALLLCGCWTVVLGRRPIQSLWTHTHTSDLKVSPASVWIFFFSFQVFANKSKKKNPNKGRAITHRKSLPFSPLPTHTYRHNITLSSKAAKYALNVKQE